MKRTPPPPNSKKVTKVPPPPTRVVLQPKEQSQKSVNFLVNDLVEETQRIQVLSQKNEVQIPTAQPKVAQVNTSKPSPKSKLQQKLQQLRKAKEQMTQQYDQERVQTQEDFVKEQKNDENIQSVNNISELQSDKIQIAEPTITKPLETKVQLVDNFQTSVNNQAKNKSITSQAKFQVQASQLNKNEIQTQQIRPKQVNKKSAPLPPKVKGKSAIPPPNIRSAPKPVMKQISALQPTSTQIQSKPLENKVQQIIEESKISQIENKAQEKVQQIPVLVSNQPEITNQQVKKVEVEIPKLVESPVNTQLNQLLERYHALKSTYVSNIHQLEELVRFNKKQEQAQIQKINKLLQQLNKKNQQIKQACGLKSQTNLEEITLQQEQLSV